MIRSDIADMHEAANAIETLESDTGIVVKVLFELEDGEMKARVRA
jgi:hypothetical protein